MAAWSAQRHRWLFCPLWCFTIYFLNSNIIIIKKLLSGCYSFASIWMIDGKSCPKIGNTNYTCIHTAVKNPYPRIAMDSSLCVESMVLMIAQNFCMKNFNLCLCSSIFSATSIATYKQSDTNMILKLSRCHHPQLGILPLLLIECIYCK